MNRYDMAKVGQPGELEVTKVDKPRRKDWIENQNRLEEAYGRYIKENEGRSPSLVKLAEITGISREKVSKHLKELDLSSVIGNSAARFAANAVFTGLAKKGAAGDANAAKLFFQVGYGYKESHDITSDDMPIGQGNTNVQVNIIEDGDE